MKTRRHPTQVVYILRGIFVYVLAALVAFGEGVAFATSKEDIQLLHVMRPKSSMQITLEIIMNAKEYVDVTLYHHDSSPPTLLLLESLRLAALRGVRVRYLYDEVASSDGTSPLSSSYLALLKTAGVEVRSLTILERLKTWGPFALIHSKILLADAGDGVHDIVKVDGRNAGKKYLTWLDNSYIFRMSKESPVKATIKEYVDHLFSLFEPLNPQYKGKPAELLARDEADLRLEMKHLLASEKSNNETEDFKMFLKSGSSKEFPAFHLRPHELHFVSSGKAKRVKGIPFKDTLSEAFQQLIQNSRKIEISTILFYLSDEKRDILKRFLKGGGQLEVLSNSEKTFPTVMANKPKVMTTSLEKMQDNELARLSELGNVTAYLIESRPFNFAHSKFVIGENSVILSSSNLNYSSDIQSEEAGFYIESKEFAAYMKEYSNQVKDQFYTKVDYKNGKKMNWIEKSCSLILRNVF